MQGDIKAGEFLGKIGETITAHGHDGGEARRANAIPLGLAKVRERQAREGLRL